MQARERERERETATTGDQQSLCIHLCKTHTHTHTHTHTETRTTAIATITKEIVGVIESKSRKGSKISTSPTSVTTERYSLTWQLKKKHTYE